MMEDPRYIGSFAEADGLFVNVDITFKLGAEVSSTTGCTVECHAKMANSPDIVVGVAAVTGASSATMEFDMWSFYPGRYVAQLRLIPAGSNGYTFEDFVFDVRESIKPRPSA